MIIMKTPTIRITQVNPDEGSKLTPEFWNFLEYISKQNFKKVGRITQIT